MVSLIVCMWLMGLSHVRAIQIHHRCTQIRSKAKMENRKEKMEKTKRAPQKRITCALPRTRMRYGWEREKREPGRVGMPPA